MEGPGKKYEKKFVFYTALNTFDLLIGPGNTACTLLIRNGKLPQIKMTLCHSSHHNVCFKNIHLEDPLTRESRTIEFGFEFEFEFELDFELAFVLEFELKLTIKINPPPPKEK